MRLLKHFLVLLIFVFGFGSALAQKSPVDIQQVNNPGINHLESVKNHTFDYLLTLMSDDLSSNIPSIPLDGNNATLRLFGENNSATIIQSGNKNLGFIQIGSSSNQVTSNIASVNQNGSRLISIVNIQGNNNFLDFNQRGFNRGALFDFQGNNLQFNAQQIGSSFRLTPRNSTMPVLDISTTRQTLPIIIRNN